MLRDRAAAAGYGNKLGDDDVFELRIEMAVLSSQYFDLTGEVLKINGKWIFAKAR